MAPREMTLHQRFTIAAFAFTAVSALVLSACGGGGEEGAGQGRPVTDPSLVPSSTPIGQNATLYQIRNDTISIVGGASASVTPNSQASATARANYTILPGEGCSVIADKLGISLDALLKANRTINAECTNLKAGEQLKVPAAPATTPVPGASATPRSSGKEYTVVSGDDCGTIAASYGVDVKAFIALNGIDAGCLNLKIGQKVKIP